MWLNDWTLHVEFEDDRKIQNYWKWSALWLMGKLVDNAAAWGDIYLF